MKPATPYTAPSSDIHDLEPGSSPTAFVIGAAIGNGISYAVLFLMGLVFVWVLTAQGVAPQDLYVRVYQSTGYLLFAHAAALLCSVPGGYWSARLGPARPYLNATLAGCIVSALNLSANLMPYDLPVPLWSRIASIVIPLPAFLLGARWRLRDRAHALAAA